MCTGNAFCFKLQEQELNLRPGFGDFQEIFKISILHLKHKIKQGIPLFYDRKKKKK